MTHKCMRSGIALIFSQHIQNIQNISNLRQGTIGNLSNLPNMVNLQSFLNKFGNIRKFSITPHNIVAGRVTNVNNTTSKRNFSNLLHHTSSGGASGIPTSGTRLEGNLSAGSDTFKSIGNLMSGNNNRNNTNNDNSYSNNNGNNGGRQTNANNISNNRSDGRNTRQIKITRLLFQQAIQIILVHLVLIVIQMQVQIETTIIIRAYKMVIMIVTEMIIKNCKSSLFLTFFRLLEHRSSCIRIDETDCSQLSLQKLQPNLSTIPQTPVLFSETVRCNIDPMLKGLLNKLIECILYDQICCQL